MSVAVLTIRDVMWMPQAEALLPRLDKPVRRLLERLLRHPGVLLMAGSESALLSAQLISQPFGGNIYTPPDHVYLGLWESALDRNSDGDTAGEAAYTSYARAEVGTGNNQEDAWDAPSDDGSTVSVSNMNAVAWPTCTGGSATVIYGAAIDETESGAFSCWFSTSSVAISSGVTPQLAAGALLIERT